MTLFRKLKALAVSDDPDPETLAAELEKGGLPVSHDPCRTCMDPCEEHEPYPARFDVDMETKLLGSIKPFHRQIIISSGKSDWPHEITEASGTLAAYVLHAQESTQSTEKKAHPQVPGVFSSENTSQITILNGSHDSLDHEHTAESVIVLPDYKVVTRVLKTQEGANVLWKYVINPEVGRVGLSGAESPLESYILPYSFIITICSHTRRDKRCGIAAPILEREFIRVLESKGWHAHTRLEDPTSEMGPPIEKLQGSDEEKEKQVVDLLKSLSELKSVLLLRCSHVGGHKYVGNCLIHTPQGSCIWYGRVTSHHVETIVSTTLIEGKILPRLLRGGLNLARPGCHALSDW